MDAFKIRARSLFQATTISVSVLVTFCAVSARPASAQPPVNSYEIVATYPHAQDAFTQGLVYENGRLFESTGLNGSSSLREVDLHTGAVLRRVDVPAAYFAEGMTLFQGKIFQLTWQSQVGFIYDPASFAKIGEFAYTGEGWGLTHDAQHLIMSDGTNSIRFLDPQTFQVVRTVAVVDHLGQPLNNINELEYINGEIYANIWQTDRIARINPANGAIIAWIDLTGLRTSGDVLNGIAYDAATGHLLVTGKWWPSLFRINVVTTAGASPQITSPAPGATLSATSQVFTWTAGTGVAQYWLYVGSTQGANDLSNQDRGVSLNATVASLPADGRTVYVRLWWLRAGAWDFADFMYTAATSVAATNPQITQPAAGTTLADATQVFQWSAGTSISQYWLTVGNSPGATDLYSQDQGLNLSASVSGLPTDGRALHVRLWWLRAGSWLSTDVQFTAATTVAATNPQISQPAPGTTLTSATQVFQWSPGTSVSQYWVTVGSSPGAADLYSQDQGLNLSASVSGLPSDGRALHVRLWWLRAGSWQSADFTYTAAGATGGTTTNPQISTPVPGATLNSTAQSFQWSAGTGATWYWLYVGSTPGGADLVDYDAGSSLSVTVNRLPADGRTIYVRLWWVRNNSWEFADFTYRAAGG